MKDRLAFSRLFSFITGLTMLAGLWGCGSNAGAPAVQPTDNLAGYTITDLGSPFVSSSNGFYSMPGDPPINGLLQVNNRGEVVAGWPGPAGVWENGSLVRVGTLGTGTFARSFGINDRGDITGKSDLTPPSATTFQHAFLYAGDRLTDLGTLGGGESMGFAVNNQDQVVGIAQTTNGAYAPFLWQQGKMTQLPAATGDEFSSYAFAINNVGQILGVVDLHPTLWNNGQEIDLSTPAYGSFATAAAINDVGQIVGESTGYQAQVWQNGIATSLGTLGGPSSYPYAINNRGDIVGMADTTTSSPFDCATCPPPPAGDGYVYVRHPFIYHDGRMLDLTTLLPTGSNVDLATPVSINDSGKIAAFGAYKGESGPQSDRYFLLTPVYRPDSSRARR